MKIEYKGDEIIISEFKPLEAYKIARKLEAEGINFYKALIETIQDSAVKRSLELLLSEEKWHLETFEKKIGEISGPFEETAVVDEIDTKVFSFPDKPLDLASVVKDRKRAFELGMLMEKRSISFFEACRDKTSDASTKKAFEEIIKEEERHLGLLKEMYNLK
jgi:rubrerythrin